MVSFGFETCVCVCIKKRKAFTVSALKEETVIIVLTLEASNVCMELNLKVESCREQAPLVLLCTEQARGLQAPAALLKSSPASCFPLSVSPLAAVLCVQVNGGQKAA